MYKTVFLLVRSDLSGQLLRLHRSGPWGQSDRLHLLRRSVRWGQLPRLHRSDRRQGRLSQSHHADPSVPLAAGATRPSRAGSSFGAGRTAHTAAGIAADFIHPIAGRTVSAVPSAELRAIVHIVLPFRKFAGTQ